MSAFELFLSSRTCACSKLLAGARMAHRCGGARGVGRLPAAGSVSTAFAVAPPTVLGQWENRALSSKCHNSQKLCDSRNPTR